MSQTLQHADYTIAWIAILPIEVEVALGALDERHHGHFESVRGDDYTYIGGEIKGHNVVIAKLPVGQNYGVGAAAALVSHVKARFENIWFALLVGVAAGLPNLLTEQIDRQRDIRLGDVLVCVPDKSSTGIIHYDLGRDTDQGFETNGRQAEPPALVRAAIGDIQLIKKPFRAGNELAILLDELFKSVDDNKFNHPGQDQDEFFEYRSHDQSSLTDTITEREPRDDLERTYIWYGRIGSGSTLMRNARRRDELRDRYDLIGLEMEAAGVMNTVPTGVVRGVCDYGDGHKTKIWQPYAALVAAVYAKAILSGIRPKARWPVGTISDRYEASDTAKKRKAGNDTAAAHDGHDTNRITVKPRHRYLLEYEAQTSSQPYWHVPHLITEADQDNDNEDLKSKLLASTNDGQIRSTLNPRSLRRRLSASQSERLSQFWNQYKQVLVEQLQWFPERGQQHALFYVMLKAKDGLFEHDGVFLRTLVHMLAMNNVADLLPKLVETGFDVNAGDSDFRTPLHLAVIMDHYESVQALVEECKADVHRKDLKGLLPWHEALYIDRDNLSDNQARALSKQKILRLLAIHTDEKLVRGKVAHDLLVRMKSDPAASVVLDLAPKAG